MSDDDNMLGLVGQGDGDVIESDSGGVSRGSVATGREEEEEVGLGGDHLKAVVRGELLAESDEGLEGERVRADKSDVVSCADAGDCDGSHVEAEAGGLCDGQLGIIY